MSDELSLAFARRTPPLTSLGDGLHLGRGSAAEDSALLDRHGITHILNVADDVQRPPSTKDLVYHCLAVGDFGSDAGISRVFDDALAFVQPALEAGGQVLVHCANGSNRSPSVAIALLMMLHDWSLATAWAHVSSRRTVQPLADNRRELLAFEARRRGGTSMVEAESGGTLVPLEETRHGGITGADEGQQEDSGSRDAHVALGTAAAVLSQSDQHRAVQQAEARKQPSKGGRERRHDEHLHAASGSTEAGALRCGLAGDVAR